MGLLMKIANVYQTLRAILRRLRGNAKTAKPALKAFWKRELKLLVGVLRNEGLKKMRELDKDFGPGGGGRKGRKWDAWAKRYLKSYFKDVGQQWKKDHKVPLRRLQDARQVIFAEHRP